MPISPAAQSHCLRRCKKGARVSQHRLLAGGGSGQGAVKIKTSHSCTSYGPGTDAQHQVADPEHQEEPTRESLGDAPASALVLGQSLRVALCLPKRSLIMQRVLGTQNVTFPPVVAPDLLWLCSSLRARPRKVPEGLNKTLSVCTTHVMPFKSCVGYSCLLLDLIFFFFNSRAAL